MEKGRSHIGKGMIGLIIYVCLSAMGLTLIKVGLGNKTSLSIDPKGFSLSFSWILIIGMCLYILSFLTSLLVMKSMSLSMYYPFSAGLIYILVCVLSVIVLKEKIGLFQLIGMAVIFVGILIMNIQK